MFYVLISNQCNFRISNKEAYTHETYTMYSTKHTFSGDNIICDMLRQTMP